MAEEDVADVVAVEKLRESLGLVQLDPVHQRVADGEGWMVHEEIGRGAVDARQLRSEPIAARRIIEAGRGRRAFQRIEKEKVTAVARDGALHVSLAAEHLAKVGAVVVIAEHEMSFDGKAGKALPERLVDGGFALLGEIAGDGAERSIDVVLLDIGEAGVEAGHGIEAPQQISRRHEMKISDVDELHVGPTCSLRSLEPGAGPPRRRSDSRPRRCAN